MPTFDLLDQLFKHIESTCIKSAMEQEVEKVARDTLKLNVDEEVYKKYNSKAKNPYKRTGGLKEDKNIETKMEDDTTLTIRSIRSENGRDIAKVIEDGEGYTWVHSEIYKRQPFPRPFHEKTAEMLEKGLAKDALKEGLKRQGLDVT